MKYRRIAVLMGGMSSEREVSLASGEAVARGLEESGYEVVRIDAGRDVDRRVREAAPDAAYVALHGRWGEDGIVQGLLEMLGVPYTGSSVLASALAMDKVLSRTVFAAGGIPVAPGTVLGAGDSPRLPDGVDFPVVVKPADGGSSVGVAIVRDSGELAAATEAARRHSDRALVESLIEGAEINVAVLDGEVLGSVEIVPNAGEFYDYASKYDEGGSTHHVPPRLSEQKVARLERIGLAAYDSLGCRGAARVDLMVPDRGDPAVLEVNTIPGMTDTSLLPEIAAHRGISFPRLVARIVEGARLHLEKG
ncbi:MAG: D-alanine--D-alanine ligase [Polyangia bacterium]